MGFSLSLLNVSQIAKSSGTDVETVLRFLDAPHASASWPSTSVYSTPEHLKKRKREEKFIDIPKPIQQQESESAKGHLYGENTII